jgi:hypothetical protein
MASVMVKESWSITTIASLKGIGKETISKEWVMKNFPIVAAIWVSILTANLKELENTLGLMGNFTKVNGLTV